MAELLEHPFFALAPPKSTGRDTFGEAWVDEVVTRARRRGLDPERRSADLLASAVELVAASVALALARHVSRLAGTVEQLLVCGGGVHNRALLAALARRLAPARVESSSAVGVDPDAREALVFAVLAARAVLGQPSTCPWATGAAAGRVLGKLSSAPVESRPFER